MLIEAEIWTVARTEQGNVVLIKPLGSETAVPIFIGQLEAQSILIGLGNIPMPRPLTHDLFLNVMGKLDLKVSRVEIISLKDGTFYAQLILQKDKTRIVIDSRPSDAIAIAVRNKTPVFIAEKVIEEAGIPISSITEDNGETATEMEKIKLHKLLDQMIETENYEEAAKIRDQLQHLESDTPESQ